MSTLGDIGKKLGEIAEITANKAKQLSEITKLNSYIAAEEREIEQIYLEIGQLIYEQSKEEAIGALGEMCKKITECKEKIVELEEEKEQIKKQE